MHGAFMPLHEIVVKHAIDCHKEFIMLYKIVINLKWLAVISAKG